MTLNGWNARFVEIYKNKKVKQAPNDSGVIEILDVQIFPSKFSTPNATLLYSNTRSLVGFSVIPKCVTLNEPE